MTPWLLASVWCLLLLGAALRPALGSGAALISSYAASAALLWWARPRQHRSVSVAGAALAGASGFVALPAWLVIVAVAAVALGLPPPRASVGPHAACVWLANVALAPLFEELLYRECLLPAMRARVGTLLALVLSSALFAAPHLEPWSVLTTFLVGLALGAVFLATDRVELCVAHHAGLNAAALACGLPPSRAALSPLASACAAVALLGLAIAVARTRGRAARPAVHAHAQADLGTAARRA
jgi:membrane protease YdiL (CAAX protease family)